MHDENGQLFSLPAGWTDVAAADPFVVIAAGRCAFTADGLLAVADLADRFRAQCDGDQGVTKIAPGMSSGLCRRESLTLRAVVIGTAIFPATKGYVHFRFSDYAKLTVIGVVIACLAWPGPSSHGSAPRLAGCSRGWPYSSHWCRGSRTCTSS